MKIALLSLIFAISFTNYSCAQNSNGFDLSNATIPVNEILDGGPGKDGIQQISNPVFLDSRNSTLNDYDRVLGIYYNGIAKAYPIKVMNYHEIVNDKFNEKPVAVTYCPLCGSGIAFNSSINDRELTFGVSGLLYNSDVLLYDHQTETLWSQFKFEAVSGPLVGSELSIISTENTTWKHWQERYPKTLVLSSDTGFNRDYDKNPYPNYNESERLYFPVKDESNLFPRKEMVLGVEVNGKFKAYPFSQLSKLKTEEIREKLNGEIYIVSFDSDSQTATIKNSVSNNLTFITTFWFAWYAFHPETSIFEPE